MFGTSSPGVLHLTVTVELVVSADEFDDVSFEEIRGDDGNVVSLQSPGKWF